MAPLVDTPGNEPSIGSGAVCVTGQHREMLGRVLSLFDRRAGQDLDITVP